MPDMDALAPILGRLWHRIPAYDQQTLDQAYVNFARSAHGQILLDVWMVNVVLAQKTDLRHVGQEDFVLFLLAAIQTAEQRQAAQAAQKE